MRCREGPSPWQSVRDEYASPTEHGALVMSNEINVLELCIRLLQLLKDAASTSSTWGFIDNEEMQLQLVQNARAVTSALNECITALPGQLELEKLIIRLTQLSKRVPAFLVCSLFCSYSCTATVKARYKRASYKSKFSISLITVSHSPGRILMALN